ncbi:TrmB family transcriptional regulator [Micromonospora sp. CB01531]|uniref:TrmB family transcriptional regulator n=1 Tax=Micromonospora sp. CB01531 TaxID=1718947 RepID=UPI00093CCFCB|nr:helix-turn-helix domain-containing protein [Micromonospora sp. CB01531]OKI49197.1 transcriptional regulator TrmB [Micromonospora sp. CB01531]
MLGALGLSTDEESVYRQLVGRAAVSSADLTDATHLPEPTVRAALSQLMADGLVKRTPDGEFSAAPPAVALGALISERRDGLHAAELALVTLAEEHRVAMAGRSISELIEVVTGVDGIRHRFAQVQHAARALVRNLVTAPFVAVPPGTNALETVMMDRGVEYRVVLERAALAEPGMIAETVASLRKGVQVRVAESLPIKLVLADADLGLVPLTAESGGEPGAVLLHRSGLLSAMDALFEIVWRHAHPLNVSAFDELTTEDAQGADSAAPTGLDRRILALLLAGLTDQAVASQLDLSLRTLQRRLRYLMDLAGVQSRMQLGWYAARHNWA